MMLLLCPRGNLAKEEGYRSPVSGSRDRNIAIGPDCAGIDWMTLSMKVLCTPYFPRLALSSSIHKASMITLERPIARIVCL
jgi:hypothetical protein